MNTLFSFCTHFMCKNNMASYNIYSKAFFCTFKKRSEKLKIAILLQL